jgi:hypothetical protein
MNTATESRPDIAAAETVCPDCGGQMTIQLVQPHPTRPQHGKTHLQVHLPRAGKDLHVTDSGSSMSFRRRLVDVVMSGLGTTATLRGGARDSAFGG